MKEIKFMVGDRVKVKNRLPGEVISVGMLGVVVGITNDEILVKFDNFTEGHNGRPYFRANHMNYNNYDKSHWYMLPSHLEKVEEKEKENE